MSALGILSDARRTPRTFGKSCPDQTISDLSDNNVLSLVRSHQNECSASCASKHLQ